MSSNSDSDKITTKKIYPIDLAQKIAIIKGNTSNDPKVSHLVSGSKISGTSGQIITHTVPLSLMRPATQIISQGISAQVGAQLVSGGQANVVGTVGTSASPLLQGAQIISQGTQGQTAVRTLPTAVRLLSPLNLPSLPLQHLATPVSTTSPRPQNTIAAQSVTAAKQLTTSYHVPRGPAAVASLAVPRGSAAPRAPTPSPTPSWSTGSPQCYVPRPPRPHTLQVAAPRPSLRQITPQVTTATVVARAVRPANTPSPQRTPPPQGLQAVASVRTAAPKVVPLVQRNYQPGKVVGVATLGVRPTISPRTVGNTYYYEVSSGVATAQPTSSTPPTSVQHPGIHPASTPSPAPVSSAPTIQLVSSSPAVVSQTIASSTVPQLSLSQQPSLTLQSSQGHLQQQPTITLSHQPNLTHQNSMNQVSLPQQVNLSQQVSLVQSPLSTLAQQASLSQSLSSITQQAYLTHQTQQSLSHQSSLSHLPLSTLAHQSSLAQSMAILQLSSLTQQSSILQSSPGIGSLNQPVSISQQVHQPLNNVQTHTQLTSFAGALGNNSTELVRAPNSPGGPQRPSILRKREQEGSPLKCAVPPPPVSSPPHSPGGSTTVSAASSPGPEDDDSPSHMMQGPLAHSLMLQSHSQHHSQHNMGVGQQHVMTGGQQHNMTPGGIQQQPHGGGAQQQPQGGGQQQPLAQAMVQAGQPTMQSIMQPVQPVEQPYNNCSPRKKPRKQLLPSETRSTRGGECEFPPDGIPAVPVPSPPHAASPPTPAVPPQEREKPRRRAMLGAGWKCGWRATALHFVRPTDVRRREERRPSVVELAAQRHVLQKANGWKIHHLTAQMDDLGELESGVLQQAAGILKMLESKPQPDHHNICELLKGNIQRTKIVGEGVAEARNNVLRVFQHKSHVSDILTRQADKRCFKKHRNQC